MYSRKRRYAGVLTEEALMKPCPYCLNTDLHDNARKCHHCGAWLGGRGILRNIAEVICWIFVVVFVGALASCGVSLINK